MKSPSTGPLAKGWNEWRDGLKAHGRNKTEIEIAHTMFYVGAKVAAMAASNLDGTEMCRVMLREVREFERKRLGTDA